MTSQPESVRAWTSNLTRGLCCKALPMFASHSSTSLFIFIYKCSQFCSWSGFLLFLDTVSISDCRTLSQYQQSSIKINFNYRFFKLSRESREISRTPWPTHDEVLIVNLRCITGFDAKTITLRQPRIFDIIIDMYSTISITHILTFRKTVGKLFHVQLCLQNKVA